MLDDIFFSSIEDDLCLLSDDCGRPDDDCGRPKEDCGRSRPDNDPFGLSEDEFLIELLLDVLSLIDDSLPFFRCIL